MPSSKHWRRRTSHLLGMAISAASLVAQERIPPKNIDPTPSCLSCRISVGPVIRRVGIPDGLDQQIITLGFAANGTIFVGPAEGGSLPLAIDRNGARRAIGRQGRGPGEFLAPAAVFVAPGDSLYVHDPRTARITVVDPQLRYVRTVPVPALTARTIWLPGRDALLLSTLQFDTAWGNRPFHLLDRTGKRIARFGPKWVPENRATTYRPYRLAPHGRNSMIAFKSEKDYELEVWNLDTRTETDRYRLGSLAPNLPKDPDGVPRPGSSLTTAVSDSAGRIWALVTVADTQWRKAVVPEMASHGWRFIEQDFTGMYDTWILVIDLARSRVVAKKAIDEGCRFLNPRFEIICDVQNPDGTYGFTIRTVELQTPPTPR